MNYKASSLPGPAGWGIRTLIAKNRQDAATMNSFNLPPADSTNTYAIAARANWLSETNDEMKDVDWLYAPNDAQKSKTDDNLHGMISDPLVWPFEPPGFSGHSLKELTSQFWHDGTPVRVVFDGDVPHTESTH